MSLDLEKGYTRIALQRSGRRVHELPAGGPHAVVRGERDTLCGRVVRARLSFPLGMGETLCADCAAELEKLESST
jgi:hypothetical protein